MRALLIPQIYKSNDASANSSVYNVAKFAEDWVERDDSIHVTIMMPDKDDVAWEEEYMHADHERVTALEFKRCEDDDRFYEMQGRSESFFETLRHEIEENYAYWDFVIDQRVYSKDPLYLFFNNAFNAQKAKVRPYDFIYYCHDIASPYKVHGKRWRNDYSPLTDFDNVMKADQVWWMAPMDRDEFKEYATEWYQYSAVDKAVEDTVVLHSQVDFETMDENYRDKPQYVHVAGDLDYAKKNIEDVFRACKVLYQRHGIETIISTMKNVDPEYKEMSCVSEVAENASYQEYLSLLSRGDMVICCSREEESPTTFFEQAASGQVFIGWDRPWLYDQIPDDYKLTAGGRKDLPKLALWAVSNWDEAVEENSRMVEHMKSLRSVPNVGKRAHDDMRRLVDERVEATSPSDWQVEALENAIRYVGEDPTFISDIDKATAQFTDSGKQMSEMYHYAYTDMILTLRQMGYKDVGTSREPAFTEAES